MNQTIEYPKVKRWNQNLRQRALSVKPEGLSPTLDEVNARLNGHREGPRPVWSADFEALVVGLTETLTAKQQIESLPLKGLKSVKVALLHVSLGDLRGATQHASF
jgi:hypothetical protein